MPIETPTWDETQPVEAGPSWGDTEPLDEPKKTPFLSSPPRAIKPSLLASTDDALARKFYNSLDKSIIPEGSLSSGPRNYDSRGNIIPSDAEKLFRPLATPENAAIMLATVGEGLIPRIAGGVFGAQGAKGVYDAAKVISDPDADAQVKHDATLSLFANVPMTVLGAHGALHSKPVGEVQGPLANGSILDIAKGSIPKWEETKPVEVTTPKPEEQNAPQIQPQPISVQEQPQGTVESGPREETSVGNSVLSPENPQVGQGAEEPLNNETASTIPATQVEAGTEIPLQQEPATSSPTPETENAPLNPGGAYADLSPELKVKSDSVKDAMRAQYEALKAQAAAPIESVQEAQPNPIVDQSVNKGGRPTTQRPPDIIDKITENYGQIKLKSAARPGTEGYYGSGYDNARSKRPSLFSKNGASPDEIADNLRRDGIVSQDFSVDDLWDAIDSAHNTRGKYFRGEMPEQKQDKFFASMSDAAKSPKHYTVSVGDLGVGDKFSIKGEPFEVKAIDPDTGEVHVKDGKKFGFQTIPDGADIPINKGSLKKVPVSDEFAPEESAVPVPKLRPGEKGTGDLLQSQDQPFNLAGEQGSDAERIQAAKDKAARDKAEGDALADKQQQGFIGLGGAIPSEFERSPQTPTGIKNATVDAERVKRGLPAAVEPLKRSFGEVWDKAMAHIDRDPKWQDDLINELRDKPRALTDEEDAAILQRQVDLQNDYGKATRDLAQAHEDGNEDLAQENKLRVAQLSDQLFNIYDIGKRSGTETGRGLNARKMMAYEDFSLAQMELSKRAANDGRPLTDNERAHITELQSRIEQTQKSFDDYVAASKERISKAESDAAIAKIKAEAASSTHKINPVILDTARKIVANLDKRADAARLRIKERLSRTSAGVDPTLLLDLAEVGASHLAHAALDLSEWSAKMVGEFGDFIKPHLDEVYKASQDKIRKATAENPLELARAMREKPPEEQIKANAARISEKVKEGKKDEITHFVQRIARLLVQSGVTEREALLTRVHDILKQSIPDITRRETMDAISGYGDFKQLTKDQISVQLRGIKGEMQQLAKLEDMAANKSPLKSGVERRIPSEAERQLIKKVNEAKFAFQVPMTDPATQLKSALDTYKTNLRNRTVDLQAKLDAKDFSPRPKRELVLDNEAMKLKAANEAVKQKFQHELALDRLKKRSAVEKTGDAIVKWRRGFILSGPVTLAKLTSAAIARMVITPAEELVGHGLSKLPLVKQISERAPREGGGFNTRAEVKAITEGLTKGASDAWQTLKTGKSDLSLVYGKDKGLPQSFIDIFGNIHGALKAPVKRAEFARSLQKRLDFYAKQGVDVTDEFVQMRAGLEAYQDADRAIFMQKNIINDAYKRALSRFDQKDKVTGKPTVGGKIAGTVSRVLFPIVKVPTNIVAETMQFAVGSITGSTRLGLTFKNGIENLKPEEADLIMRHLKKGSLGGAVMLTGFLAPQILGGFYQQGEKRNKSDIKPDAARVGDVDIPASLIHNPMVNAAQLGATVRRVSDSKLRKRDKNTQGLSHGAIAGAVGLADAVPFVRETTEIAKAMNPLERDQWAGAFAKSLVVPQAISSTAEHFDKDAQGNPIKRKTSDVTSGIESGIPGMRQTLPVKR